MAGTNPGTSLPRVYFARAIDGEDPVEIRTLALSVARELAQAGLMMIDPTIGGARLQESQMDPTLWYRAMVDDELSILRKSDALLIDMSIPNRNYIGCVCEMTYAHIWRIPCVVYAGQLNQIRPWLLYHATAIVESRGAAIAHLVKILKHTDET